MMRYIEKILNDFHACTNMYIGLFDHSDTCLLRYPLTGSLPFKHSETRKSVHLALTLLYNDKNASYVTAPYETSNHKIKDVYFTAGYIHSALGTESAYVFGPYTITKEDIYDLPYIPKFAEKNLVELLQLIITEHSKKASYTLLTQNYHINRILSYMEEHYKESLTISDIATNLQMNTSYLCRLFKVETGHTFTEHLNHLRIEKSKNLLKDSNKTFLEISQTTGFSSQSYYCRTFKKFTGNTPKEFRTRYSNL